MMQESWRTCDLQLLSLRPPPQGLANGLSALRRRKRKRRSLSHRRHRRSPSSCSGSSRRSGLRNATPRSRPTRPGRRTPTLNASGEKRSSSGADAEAEAIRIIDGARAEAERIRAEADRILRRQRRGPPPRIVSTGDRRRSRTGAGDPRRAIDRVGADVGEPTALRTASSCRTSRRGRGAVLTRSLRRN